jgi:hypothetical protein
VPVLASSAMRRRPPSRRFWTWHRWLGLTILLPLVWWTGTALVFALRPIEEVRGRTWSTGRKSEPATLAGTSLPDPESLKGVRSLVIRVVEGRQVAILYRGADQSPELFDQADGHRLGAAIPVSWALDAARRDFAGSFEPEAVYLVPRQGRGQRVGGAGPDELERPDEYAGPYPAYAIHLRGWPGMHLYVDGVDGEIRARRTSLWRFYDGAFQLHALDFLPDGVKRALMALVVLAWIGLGLTGLRLAVTWLRRPAPRSVGTRSTPVGAEETPDGLRTRSNVSGP